MCCLVSGHDLKSKEEEDIRRREGRGNGKGEE
jgi:hypothetical protein